MDPAPPVVPLPLTQRLSARQWVIVDVLVAALIAFTAIGGVAAGIDGTGRHDSAWDVLRYVLIVAACVALPYRRHYPSPVLAIIAAAVTAMVVVGSKGPTMLTVVLAIYTVASLSGPRTSLRAATIVTTVITAASLAATGGLPFVAPAVILVGWLAGENTRTRRAYIAGVTAWASERDREREERSRRAIVDERLRIARELHDVVAHTMSVVAVRSGVARVVLDRQPDEARRALEIIESSSRRALQEMRRLVGVLREGDANGDYAPAPGLDDLPQLVEEIGAAGVPVAISVEGPVRPLPPGVDVSAFRILQEALTNVVRHARPADASVALCYRADEVVITVSDDGSRYGRPVRYPVYPTAPAGDGSLGPTALATAAPPGGDGTMASGGHGLIGMRERVALFGGTFTAGPTTTGFQVSAVLPTDERPPTLP